MKRKPRVLIDTFHLINALTGIRTYTTQLCQGLEEADSEDVEYLFYPNWRWLNKTSALRGNVNVFKKIINHLLYFSWKQILLPMIVLFKRVDLVVAPDYLLPFVRFGAKSLAVFHDTFYWELKDNYNPVWRRYFLKSIDLGLKKGTGIIVTTHHIAGKVESVIGKKYPISVVYQAPKELQSGSDDRSVFERIGLKSDDKYFLHIGVFDRRKNLPLLINAFGKLRKEGFFQDFRLVLVGSRAVTWFHDDFGNIQKAIATNDLQEDVIMPGFLPDEDLDQIYKGAFAYIFPSNEEGFGIPVIEAMRSEIPVVISNHPALAEVADNAALVFEMNDQQGLEECMKSLMNPELRRELIEKGVKRSSKFTRSAFVEQFRSVVNRTLNPE